jgi:hypothetical protein
MLNCGENAMTTEGKEENANGKEIIGWMEWGLMGRGKTAGKIQKGANQNEEYGEGCCRHGSHNGPPTKAIMMNEELIRWDERARGREESFYL